MNHNSPIDIIQNKIHWLNRVDITPSYPVKWVMMYHSGVFVLSGLQLKTDLQGLIGTPVGFCLFGRSRKFNLDARWVIAQKSLIRITKEIR